MAGDLPTERSSFPTVMRALGRIFRIKRNPIDAMIAEVEARFVMVPRCEYTAEVEAARIKAIGEMEHP